MAWIIVDGTDGVGKSTLSATLATAFIEATPQAQLITSHRGEPRGKDVLEEYLDDFSTYQPDTSVNIVSDRHHISNLVYAPIYRNTGYYGNLGVDGFRFLEMWLSARGVCQWLVTQPVEVIRERLKVRGEDYLKDVDIERVVDSFTTHANTTCLNVETLTPPDGDLSGLADTMVKYALYTEYQARWTARHHDYLGSPTPTTVLVGDGLTTRENGKLRATPAGTYLLSSMSDEWWKTVAVVPSDTHFESFIEGFRNLPSFVALSMDAADSLLDVDMIFAGAPHPDAVRHNVLDRSTYGDLLERVSATGEIQFKWGS